MKLTTFLIAAILCTGTAAAADAPAPKDVPAPKDAPAPKKDAPKKDIPPAKLLDREVRDIEGWKVHVDKQLFEDAHAEAGKQALRVLAFKLYEVTSLVPKDRLEKLRKVAIVVDWDDPRLASMQYHPSEGWLKSNGHDVRVAKMVHIPRAKHLIGRLPIYQQPMVILHELAHGYHDQVLGFDEPRIKTAWNEIKQSGKFDKVAHIAGHMTKHYALTTQMEFFAEMTESYFGTNDFHPFVRAELKSDYPAIHKLMEEIWGKP